MITEHNLHFSPKHPPGKSPLSCGDGTLISRALMNESTSGPSTRSRRVTRRSSTTASSTKSTYTKTSRTRTARNVGSETESSPTTLKKPSHTSCNDENTPISTNDRSNPRSSTAVSVTILKPPTTASSTEFGSRCDHLHFQPSLTIQELRTYRRNKRQKTIHPNGDPTNSASKQLKQILNHAIELSAYPVVTDELSWLRYPCRRSAESVKDPNFDDLVSIDRLLSMKMNPKFRSLLYSLRNSGGIFESREAFAQYCKLIRLYNPEHLVQISSAQSNEQALNEGHVSNEGESTLRRRGSRDSNSEIGSRMCTRRMKKAEVEQLRATNRASDDSDSTDAESMASLTLSCHNTLPKRGRPRKHGVDNSAGTVISLGRLSLKVAQDDSVLNVILLSELELIRSIIQRENTKMKKRLQELSENVDIRSQKAPAASSLEMGLLSEELKFACHHPLGTRLRSYCLGRLRNVIWWKYSVADDGRQHSPEIGYNKQSLLLCAKIMEFPPPPVPYTDEWTFENLVQPRHSTVRSLDEIVELKLLQIIETTISRWIRDDIINPFVTARRENATNELTVEGHLNSLPFVVRGWVSPELRSIYHLLEEEDPESLDLVISNAYEPVQEVPTSVSPASDDKPDG